MQGFYCGDEPWERDVADWITLPDRALAEMQKKKKNERPAGTWLYASEKHGLVGYAALAPAKWPYPDANSEGVKHLHILWFGIRRELQGEPRDAERQERYAWQMMRDLQAEVLKRGGDPCLSLYVHVDNKRAIRFYENFGFVRVPHKVHEDNGQKFIGMMTKFHGLDDG